jgi:signal transduction histidine kinase
MNHPPSNPKRDSRRLFLPIVWLFGGIMLLFFITIGIIVYLAVTQGTGEFRSGILIPLCGVPLVFIAIIYAAVNYTFRRFGQPMAAIFSTIDSIAEGNLGARVPETYPGEFGQLARRFNRMAAELQLSEAQRRNLTADIAHELRNPLHIIQGNLEGMLDGVYEPGPDTLKATLDETRLLARLVTDLQTLSLAENRQLPLHPTRFPLSDLLDDAAASFASRAAELGVTIQAESAPGLELSADYDRLDQALSNLIANALRYTPRGGTIHLGAAAIPEGIRITVSDSGTGIPAQDLPFIFDRFWKGDRARAREGTGSGLGLAITRQLVHVHGGTIAAESEVGKGAQFTIELPPSADESMM